MSPLRKLTCLILFASAFALVEAAVVAYLRNLLISDGGYFPLKEIPVHILTVELSREAATMVVLVVVGILSATTLLGRFGAFMLIFGAWDIFYYGWLVFFEGWPQSLLDWDLFFLIPVPWIAPILAPILVSMGLIGCGGWLLIYEDEVDRIGMSVRDWGVELAAAVLILFSFMNNDRSSPPENFQWVIFFTGLLCGIGYFVWRVSATRGE